MPTSKKKSGHHRGAKEAKVATSEKLQTCDAGKNEKLALEKKNDASQSLEKFDAGAAVARQDREDAGKAQSVTNKTSTSQEPTNEAMVSGHHNHDGNCGCDPRIMASQKKPVREIPNELSVLSSTYTKDGIVLHGVEYYFDQFSTRDEAQRATDLARIMQLIATDLSEPYSIFTYRYFLQSWPDLCVLCRRRSDDLIIGCIVNKIEHKPSNNSIVRGYVAMLAVDVSFRCVGIGSRLVVAAVELMKQRTCDLIYLETPIDNKGALRLYESLGFVRDKRLTRYYMSGSDAFRLKLWLH